MKNTEINIGFEGRIFLTNEEWKTYLKRMPVRYINRKKEKRCEICGKIGTKSNPLQNAHKIGFIFGIKTLALTPEYLDNDNNIITAHRKDCNKKAELNLKKSLEILKSTVTSIPVFLNKEVHICWNKLTE